jgi:hypothetical protein
MLRSHLIVCFTLIHVDIFQIGSSASISLSNGVGGVEKVWKLNVEDDLIDSDLLLDESDLKKPDPAQLKGTNNHH